MFPDCPPPPSVSALPQSTAPALADSTLPPSSLSSPIPSPNSLMPPSSPSLPLVPTVHSPLLLSSPSPVSTVPPLHSQNSMVPPLHSQDSTVLPLPLRSRNSMVLPLRSQNSMVHSLQPQNPTVLPLRSQNPTAPFPPSLRVPPALPSLFPESLPSPPSLTALPLPPMSLLRLPRVIVLTNQSRLTVPMNRSQPTPEEPLRTDIETVGINLKIPHVDRCLIDLEPVPHSFPCLDPKCFPLFRSSITRSLRLPLLTVHTFPLLPHTSLH